MVKVLSSSIKNIIFVGLHETANIITCNQLIDYTNTSYGLYLTLEDRFVYIKGPIKIISNKFNKIENKEYLRAYYNEWKTQIKNLLNNNFQYEG